MCEPSLNNTWTIPAELQTRLDTFPGEVRSLWNPDRAAPGAERINPANYLNSNQLLHLFQLKGRSKILTKSKSTIMPGPTISAALTSNLCFKNALSFTPGFISNAFNACT